MSGVLVIGIFSIAFAVVGVACIGCKLTVGGVKWLRSKIQHETMMRPQGRYYRMEGIRL